MKRRPPPPQPPATLNEAIAYLENAAAADDLLTLHAFQATAIVLLEINRKLDALQDTAA